METGLETKVAFGDMMQAFEAFREANDERLEQIEKRMAADVVTADKVDRINRAVDEAKARLDELTLKARRPQLSGETAEPPAAREHKQAFDAYVRKGESQGLSALEAKAMSVGSGPDGGYLVPPEVEHEIGRRLYAISPLRAIGSIRQISASLYKKPFSTNGLANGWVGETQARPETGSITLAELQFPAMELYAMPSATQTLLDDLRRHAVARRACAASGQALEEMTMQVTQEGLALIRRFEGFRATAYRCPAGVWTIGFGHTSQAGPPAVTPGMTIGEDEANRILAADVQRFADEVGPLLARPVTPVQFSALVSFAYNVGTPAFRRSSVLKAVNAGRLGEVPARLRLWVKAGGRVLPGLERRRAAEAELFMSETEAQAGRGVTGMPRSVEREAQIGKAGAVVGGAAAAAGLASALPGWAILTLIVLAALGVAAWASYRWRRPAAEVA